MANNINYRVPPAFEEKKSYESWKNEVEMWKRVTELDKKKQALAVALSLTGRARDTALEISADVLNADDGMAKLVEALDNVFLKEEKDRAYDAYTDFDTIRRETDVSMADYIVHFEQRYNKMRKFDMALPDTVLAFKLLDTADLDVKDKQLALTACSTLTFASMKSALKRIFGDKTALPTNSSGGIQVRQESAFYVDQKKDGTHGSKFRSQTNQARAPLAGSNPLDRYGRRTKCAICQSTFHWAKDCPHKAEHVKMTEETAEAGKIEECNITLFSKESLSDTEIFMVEALGSAVIDTACTRTVCGEKWLDNYIHTLKESDRNKMENTQSKRAFKFGDGRVVHSTKKVKVPAKIGQTKCHIETEVVPADIPLLLSKTSLKRAKAVLDIENDKATMFQKPVPLEITSSGHYCVNIVDKDCTATCENEPQANEVLAITDGMSKEEKHKVLVKLHKQFGHASVDKLKKLLTSAGSNDDESITILNDIVSSCETCLRYNKAKPKPSVGLPMASTYNETVALDLHELEPNVWYLHMIDHFTRFSAGSIVTTKKSSEIVKHFIHSWVSVHGAPKKMFFDNGGEFNNEEMRDMAENFNIEIKTTAAYSPWSNGLCERHNQTLTEIMLKVKKSSGCDWKTALDWALMAKNTMHNVHGFSPYQLVFGQNPNLPSVLVDEPPALEGTTTSKWVGEHISALHKARTAFTEAECSERIRRALRTQLRPTDEHYETGDKVYYKRMDCNEWKGPGVVIGRDGVVIFVRHGGTYVRVHHCRLRKAKDHYTDKSVDSQESQTELKAAECDMNNVVNVPDTESIDVDTLDSVPDTENAVGDSNNDTDNIEQTNDPSNRQPPIIRTDCTMNLKAGQFIKYVERDTGISHTAKVLSRAGKATGKNKNWYNLEYTEPVSLTGTTRSADLSQVDTLQIESLDTVEHTPDRHHDDVLVTKDVSFESAKLTEISNWKKHGVFNEVKNMGQKCISTRWVCTLKDTADGIVPKARLVARGFEELNTKDLPKDSPTCASESLRLLMSVICQNQWTPHSMDIKSAFLQGNELSRDIYVRPPPEANSEGTLWKLNKCVYGLNDASLYWYNRVKETMLQTGGKMSQVDPAIFYWLDNDCNVTGVLACHVDDFIWGGSHSFTTTVIPHLQAAFQVGREEHDSFRYVGMEYVTANGITCMHQDNYIQNLQPIHMDTSRAMSRDAPLTESEIDDLRSKIGQLLWVARQSRPDIMFDTCVLAANIKHATVQSLHDTNKVVRKLKSEKVTLKFQNLGKDSSLKLVVFCDASLGNLPDGGTQGGHLIMLMGEEGRFSPVYWQSKKIRRVVRSTLAGETLALADAVDSAISLSDLYAELTTGHALPIVCVTDNHSLADAIKSTKSVTEKRLRIEISGIKELLHGKRIQQILWAPTGKQLADCLTKRGASALQLLKALSVGVWKLE